MTESGSNLFMGKGATLREYLASGNETYQDSHPCYRNPWLSHIQVFKALMGQPPEKEPSVKDGEPATAQRSSRLWNSPPEHCRHPGRGFYH